MWCTYMSKEKMNSLGKGFETWLTFSENPKIVMLNFQKGPHDEAYDLLFDAQMKFWADVNQQLSWQTMVGFCLVACN